MKASSPLVWLTSILLLGSMAGCAENDPVPYEAYVTIDVNPSIAFVLNERDYVQAVHPLNEDGELTLLHLQLDHLVLDRALTLYVDEVLRLGFWPQDTDQALVEVDVTSSRLTVEQNVSQLVQTALQEQLATRGKHFLIRTRQYEASLELEAEQTGLRAKELRMMNLAMMSDPSQPLGNYRLMSNQALVQRIQNQVSSIRSIAYALREEFFLARDVRWNAYQMERQLAEVEWGADADKLASELDRLQEAYQLDIQSLRATYQDESMVLRTQLEDLYQQRLGQ